jgi:hypothetical protein
MQHKFCAHTPQLVERPLDFRMDLNDPDTDPTALARVKALRQALNALDLQTYFPAETKALLYFPVPVPEIQNATPAQLAAEPLGYFSNNFWTRLHGGPLLKTFIRTLEAIYGKTYIRNEKLEFEVHDGAETIQSWHTDGIHCRWAVAAGPSTEFLDVAHVHGNLAYQDQHYIIEELIAKGLLKRISFAPGVIYFWDAWEKHRAPSTPHSKRLLLVATQTRERPPGYALGK